MHNIKAADLQEVPKNRPILWVLDAYYMGNECPLLVLSMVSGSAFIPCIIQKKAVTAD